MEIKLHRWDRHAGQTETRTSKKNRRSESKMGKNCVIMVLKRFYVSIVYIRKVLVRQIAFVPIALIACSLCFWFVICWLRGKWTRSFARLSCDRGERKMPIEGKKLFSAWCTESIMFYIYYWRCRFILYSLCTCTCAESLNSFVIVVTCGCFYFIEWTHFGVNGLGAPKW